MFILNMGKVANVPGISTCDSSRGDILSKVISSTQLSHPLIVRTFCLQEATNQKSKELNILISDG